MQHFFELLSEKEERDELARELREVMLRLHRLCGFSREGCSLHLDNDADDIDGFSVEQARSYQDDIVRVFELTDVLEIEPYEYALAIWRELANTI